MSLGTPRPHGERAHYVAGQLRARRRGAQAGVRRLPLASATLTLAAAAAPVSRRAGCRVRSTLRPHSARSSSLCLAETRGRLEQRSPSQFTWRCAAPDAGAHVQAGPASQQAADAVNAHTRIATQPAFTRTVSWSATRMFEVTRTHTGRGRRGRMDRWAGERGGKDTSGFTISVRSLLSARECRHRARALLLP